MNFFKVFLVVIFLCSFFSCADRYSTRKKTTQELAYQKITLENHRKKQGISSKKQKTAKNNTKEVENQSKITQNKTKSIKSKKKSVRNDENLTENQQIVKNKAFSYLGSPYKYGGTTPKGFDCSGFVSASFAPLNISLERSSHLMANQGVEISLEEAQIGDLLFFVTTKATRISHVGIVVSTQNDEIKFIHASTSRGVIVSSLDEGYWANAFRKVKRILR